MTINRKTMAGAPLLALFLTVASTASAADKNVPISGFISGAERDTVQGDPPDRILVEGYLPGLADPLGHFTFKTKLL